ncbi:MAG: metal-sensitive transcriptional regulator [Chloroflexi bacterium]|nr:metal-sensitive transcriptional regulator [Chloroflexota bacterium]
MAEDFKTEMNQRLKRIEGQARGIQKMVDEGRDCGDIMHQLNAINEAVRSASRLMAEQFAMECLQTTGKRGKARDALAAEMVDVISRVPR